MILPASYQNGFAPRDGQPLYPSLWTGCVGAWNPGLGPTGLTLRDNSGFKNNGTLTNGPTFAASQGRYAMNFDGTDDFVDFGKPSALNIPAAITISAWINNSNRTLYDTIVSNYNSTGEIEQYDLTIYTGADADKPVFNVSSAGNAYKAWLAPALTSGRHHLAVTRTDTLTDSSVKIYVDGVSQTLTTNVVGSVTNPTSGFGNTAIGRGGSFNGNFFGGVIDDVRIYNRALSPDEIRTLATRPGIAYEMAPRRRSSVQVTTNRLRRALIGS